MAEIFFEVGSDSAVREKYGQPVIIEWQTGVSTTRRVGGVGNVYNVFDTTNSQKQIKYSSIQTD